MPPERPLVPIFVAESRAVHILPICSVPLVQSRSTLRQLSRPRHCAPVATRSERSRRRWMFRSDLVEAMPDCRDLEAHYQ